MKEYISPELEVIEIKVSDVITTSGNDFSTSEDELPGF